LYFLDEIVELKLESLGKVKAKKIVEARKKEDLTLEILVEHTGIPSEKWISWATDEIISYMDFQLSKEEEIRILKEKNRQLLAEREQEQGRYTGYENLYKNAVQEKADLKAQLASFKKQMDKMAREKAHLHKKFEISEDSDSDSPDRNNNNNRSGSDSEESGRELQDSDVDYDSLYVSKHARSRVPRRSEGRTRPQSRSPMGPKMASFSGTESWESFIFQFERLAKRRAWGKDKKLDRIIDCLRDKALEYARRSKACNSYSKLVSRLEKRFGVKEEPKTIQKELNFTKQQEGETLEEFSSRVYYKVMDAYPTLPENMIQGFTTDYFLRGIKDRRISEKAMDKRPKNVYEAIKYVKFCMANQKLLYGDRYNVTRKVTFCDSDLETDGEVRYINQSGQKNGQDSEEQKMTKIFDLLLPKLEQKIRDVVKDEVKKSRAYSPGRSSSPGRLPPGSPVACFDCGGPHFVRDCPKRKARSQSPSPDTSSTLNC
jgi:hypothetical protein